MNHGRLRPILQRIRSRFRSRTGATGGLSASANGNGAASAVRRAAAGQAPDPDVMREIVGLELISRRVVDGLLSGRHRSTHKGGCCEFTQHRPYTRGDELRLIDWQIYGRRDRYYVRQFEEETNLQALLVLDASGSMRFGLSTPTKFDFARRAAASMARLLLRQRDAAGLAIIAENSSAYIPPRQKPAHLRGILHALAGAEAEGPARLGLAQQLRECAVRLRRGMILIFSDCFEDVPALGQSLRYLSARGHDVLVFHILAPEEVDFQFRHWSSFQSLELRHDRLDVDPAAIRDEYLRRFDRFLADLQETVTSSGSDYVRIMTDRDLGAVLNHFLRRRAKRPAGGGRRRQASIGRA